MKKLFACAPSGTVGFAAVAGQIKKPERGPFFAVAEERDELIAR